MNLSKATFVAESNGAYGYGGDATLHIDNMRASEFPHMNDSVYLDHAGTTIYSQKQLNAVFQEFQSGLFTNPHSLIGQERVESTTTKIEYVRSQVLSFFSASEKEYTLVFTSGATAALKLVGENFPWTEDSMFTHSMDSHTSVLGIREYAAVRGATIQCIGLEELEQLERNAAGSRQGAAPAACSQSLESSKPTSMSLFAFPAECNFSGTRHRLKDIVENVHAGQWNKSLNQSTQWLVLVDAAKYVTTHPLDLSMCQPDFVVLSFYKIFGYPTGLGALIMRKSAVSYLKKQYHGGGTVQSILAGKNYFIPRGIDNSASASARFADGTQSFLSILALRHGIEQVKMLGMANISAHTTALRMLLVGKLAALHHWNDRPICEIYGQTTSNMDANQQGPIVACNFLRPDGSYIGYSEVHKLADIHKIHLRSGCFCNPGACQHYLRLKESDLMSNIAAGHVCGDDIDMVNGLPTGAIRLSLGYMTTFEDVAGFVEFAAKYFVCRSTLLTFTPTLRPVLSSKRPHLCKITLYPIKSCSGLVVDAWPIGLRGLLFDREFAIVDISSGKVLTLKALPKLCFLFPFVDLRRQCLTISYRVPDHLRPRQSAELPSQSPPSSFTISLRADVFISKHSNDRSLRSMQICRDMCTGSDVGSDVSQWLSLCLGRRCSLVRISNNHVRTSQSTHSKLDPKEATRGAKDSKASSIGFANQAPFLLISRQSIAHFNSVLADVDKTLSFSEDAFRANFIVDGCAESFEEDKWHHVRIGVGVFDVLGPCSRCSVINLDPYTSQFHPKPLQVLSSYRRQRSNIFFGQFLASTSETLWLHVGDDVVPLESLMGKS
ncbi:hypothetical protein PsorP6_001225 [Peronosclerospora sorghi]|uniref:Uncharacterized protein n=1 Tax=Peronosclerospora sorghi TaxID=230839 RepID=A0ACC0WYH0_9STRA|nr:hypothetical protein PsorP6_001225 [Peronosclerospora sorghi]